VAAKKALRNQPSASSSSLRGSSDRAFVRFAIVVTGTQGLNADC
jgi:hypothetical protein